MKGKILLVTGLGVGYVLGAKAGRERYEQIKRFTDKFWHSKGVQKQVHKAEDVIADKAPDVAKLALKGVKKVTGRSNGTAKASTARPVPPSAPITPQI